MLHKRLHFSNYYDGYFKQFIKIPVLYNTIIINVEF